MDLVIVESPKKAKTIEKYLGGGYEVIASGGHVSDLPERRLGIDVEHNFEPEYVINPDKERTIKQIKSKVDKADKVYLATDPDREGEAISWHLKNVLGLSEDKIRIEFNEISKKAVTKALGEPRYIDMNLVDAQQARRVLDRLVGYKVSPIISKKIKKGLSAGRVQSVALKMLVDREREIRNFVPVESWNIYAHLEKEGKKKSYKTSFVDIDGKKTKVKDETTCLALVDAISKGTFGVDNVKRATSISKPNPPFTTSTMQQDASNKLSFSSPDTMKYAQQLYEGIDIKGEGHVALVTYIRTDSVRISDDAQADARAYIKETYGAEYVPNKPNNYHTSAQAQDAHEAIRPIDIRRTPESMKDKLDRNQYRLYKLIYERFMASQMSNALYDTLTVHIVAKSDRDYGFQLKGKTLKFAGFTKVYASASEDDKDKDDNVKTLPSFDEGESLVLDKIDKEQKFTTPPQRYSDASLVKGMTDNGIGRPSTYASIIQVLSKRSYTEKEGKYIKPTELGETVTDQLVKYFPNIMNSKFTAEMESDLDKIGDGKIEWKKVISDFYPDFIDKVNKAANDGARVKLKEEETDIICEKCGAHMVIREGRYGKFLACPNFPNCRNTKKFKEDKDGHITVIDTTKSEPKEQIVSDVKCEKCGAFMVIKESARGKFLACPNYPKCRNIKPLEKEEVVGKCPKCGSDVVKKFNKRGKTFYGCSSYPKCDYIAGSLEELEQGKTRDNTPSESTQKYCPICNSSMKTDGKSYVCSNPDCGYKEDIK